MRVERHAVVVNSIERSSIAFNFNIIARFIRKNIRDLSDAIANCRAERKDLKTAAVS